MDFFQGKGVWTNHGFKRFPETQERPSTFHFTKSRGLRSKCLLPPQPKKKLMTNLSQIIRLLMDN